MRREYMLSKVIGGRGMLSNLPIITALGLALTVATHQATAVDVTTDPVGFITLTATGTNTFPTGYSFLGLGMSQLPAVRGIVTGVSGTALAVNNSLTAGQ